MTAFIASRASATAAGLAADRLLGEPPALVHPVAKFGMTMQAAERVLYADRRSSGIAYAALGTIGPALVGRLANRRGRAASWAALSAATYIAVAGRSLIESAAAVAEPLEHGNLNQARSLLPTLVGRDPASLDGSEISRAVVESVAENTVDAVVAPTFWAALGGAPAVLAYRAINTLDAMVGHHSDRYHRFGWAAAKADDIAGWVPARLTAALVAGIRPSKAKRIWRAVRTQAPAHPSPNAGVAEAAFAAALGIRLGGTNVYGGHVERRPDLGEGPRATHADIGRANELSRDVVRTLAAILAISAALPTLARISTKKHGSKAR